MIVWAALANAIWFFLLGLAAGEHLNHDAFFNVNSTQQAFVSPSTLIGSTAGMTLFLQLTDVHISKLEFQHGDDPGQRALDMMMLASQVLARWPLAAALITGDLTEAKDEYGHCQQDEAEWKVYAAVWKNLTLHSVVPEGRVYDMRGNHDTFNAGTRCGPQDLFCRYSARAAMSTPAHDDNMTLAASSRVAVATDRAGAPPPVPGNGPMSRVYIDPLYDDVTHGRSALPGWGRRATSASILAPAADVCPSAVLVGIDASLDPGTRSPTNFLGTVWPEMLEELDKRLAASLAGMRRTGCAPIYIAYGHYPLSTLAYPGHGRRWSQAAPEVRAPGLTAPTASPGSVQQVLLRHGVSAYLAGHLHGAFGRHLHRLHRAPCGHGDAAEPPSGAAGVGAQAAASCGCCGHWSSNGTAASDQPSGHLLELESVDWKHARTLRLLTIDGGSGAVGFTDLSYRAGPAGGTKGAHRELSQSVFSPYDTTRQVKSYLPLIVYPPDARYSPQLRPTRGGPTLSDTASHHHDTSASGGSMQSTMRVLVLPVGPMVPAVPESVYLVWSCSVPLLRDGEAGSSQPVSRDQHSRQQQYSARRELSGWMQMRLDMSSDNHSIYSVDLTGGDLAELAVRDGRQRVRQRGDGVRGCPQGVVYVQVHVSDHKAVSRSNSTSERRPLHWPIADGPCGASAYPRPTRCPAPEPLEQTGLEWVIMHVPWHRFGTVAFWAQWSVLLFGLLLAPRAVMHVKRRRARRAAAPQLAQRAARQDPAGLQADCLGPRAQAAVEESSADEGCSTSVRLRSRTGALCTSRKRSSNSLNASNVDEGASGSQCSQVSSENAERLGREAEEASHLHAADPSATGVYVAVGASSGGHGRPSQILHGSRLPWLLKDFMQLADSWSLPWLALTSFCIYLATGPWFVARFVADTAPGSTGALGGYGVLMAHGIYMWYGGVAPGGEGRAARWMRAPSQDHVVIVNVVLLACIGPAMVLCASIAARWRQLAADWKLHDVRQLVSWRQAVAIAVLLVLDFGLCWKLWSGLYWAPVLLSPAPGLILPLFSAWLVLVRHQVIRQAAAGHAAGL